MITFLQQLGLVDRRSHSGYGMSYRLLRVVMPVIAGIAFILWKMQGMEKVIGMDMEDIHVVLSTGCSPSQNWQSEVLMYSWKLSKHPGKLTRIASGCENEEQKLAAQRTAISEANIFFSPDYCEMDEIVMGDEFTRKRRYCHLWNKPMGMNYWLDNAKISESVVVLLDPDQIIVKPFEVHMKSIGEHFVSEGKPTHNRYGYGCEWQHHCTQPHCKKLSCNEARLKYTVGPPYMMHINDWRKLAPLWKKYSHVTRPEDYKDDGIMFEMYSFSAASAHLNFYTSIVEYMISNLGANEKAWKRGYNADLTLEYAPNTMFHYCSGYYIKPIDESSPRQGGFNFHKGHVPEKIMTTCDMPLLSEAPTGKTAFELDANKNKRSIFMLHWIIKYINEAVTDYRNKFCPKGWNNSKVIFMHQPGRNPGYFYIPGEEKRKYDKQGLVPWSDHHPPYDDPEDQFIGRFIPRK